MKINVSHKQLLLFITATLIIGGAISITRLLIVRHIVTRNEVTKLTKSIEAFNPISDVNILGSLFHDDAEIIYRIDTKQEWTETKQQYINKLIVLSNSVANGDFYSYDHSIVNIKTDIRSGTATVDLKCRIRYKNHIRHYSKSLVLDKINGQLGIIRRESFIQEEKLFNNNAQ